MLKPATATALVGRHRELEILSGRLDLACSGRGSVAMLVGEPGVGKTRLAQELADRAAQRGAVVLAGCCLEGDWQPPYAPWVEALGRHARASDPERLRDSLAGGAAYLAHLIPEVRAALPYIPPAEPLRADDERLRLLDAIVQFLMASSRENVHVLVLDDLHWADRDSLLLLRHLARFVNRARFLVIGAYRDTELDPVQRRPLADFLAMLRRETDYEHIVIRHLSRDEVSEYLAHTAGQPLPQALVEAIYAEASGNPFYVREILRHLVEEGKVLHRAGRWSTDTSIAELGIPEGVRQVVDRRVSRLSEETRSLLRIVAGFADRFDFPLLQMLTGLTEDALLSCLDEALQAGLLRVTETPPASPAYHFAHAIVRHTLYDSLRPDRRVRLHRRLALALERVYPGRELECAAELAWQYWSSAGLPDAGQGIQYTLAAAEQARQGFAPERVVSFLRMARDLVPGNAPAIKGDILSRLAIAEAEAFLLEDARRSVGEALAALSASGAEPAVSAEVIVSVARALKEGGASPNLWEALVERGLALVGGRRDLTWARLMLLRENWSWCRAAR
jgi:predicted ATPase